MDAIITETNHPVPPPSHPSLDRPLEAVFLLYLFMRQRGKLDARILSGKRKMASQPTSAITQLLDAAARGDAVAVDRFWSAAHGELRALARALLAREGSDCSLQPTALVNEAYLRLGGHEPFQWANRRHFFGAAAQAMRRILVEHARRRGSLKHGGGQAPLPLVDEPAAPKGDGMTVLAIDEALEKLEQVDPLAAEIVTLRYLFGLSIDETAAALDVSARTVDNKWRSARAWLHRELSKGDSTWCGRGHRG